MESKSIHQQSFEDIDSIEQEHLNIRSEDLNQQRQGKPALRQQLTIDQGQVYQLSPSSSIPNNSNIRISMNLQPTVIDLNTSVLQSQ